MGIINKLNVGTKAKLMALGGLGALLSGCGTQVNWDSMNQLAMVGYGMKAQSMAGSPQQAAAIGMVTGTVQDQMEYERQRQIARDGRSETNVYVNAPSQTNQTIQPYEQGPVANIAISRLNDINGNGIWDNDAETTRDSVATGDKMVLGVYNPDLTQSVNAKLQVLVLSTKYNVYVDQSVLGAYEGPYNIKPNMMNMITIPTISFGPGEYLVRMIDSSGRIINSGTTRIEERKAPSAKIADSRPI